MYWLAGIHPSLSFKRPLAFCLGCSESCQTKLITKRLVLDTAFLSDMTRLRSVGIVPARVVLGDMGLKSSRQVNESGWLAKENDEGRIPDSAGDF
jgi:hypothetical protein